MAETVRIHGRIIGKNTVAVVVCEDCKVIVAEYDGNKTSEAVAITLVNGHRQNPFSKEGRPRHNLITIDVNSFNWVPGVRFDQKLVQ